LAFAVTRSALLLHLPSKRAVEIDRERLALPSVPATLAAPYCVTTAAFSSASSLVALALQRDVAQHQVLALARDGPVVNVPMRPSSSAPDTAA
jgi:hypothetical protein